MKISVYIYIFVGTLVLGLASCTSMGPKSIRSGRMEYNNALAQSESEQLLLNIVKMRFLDRPVFLNVTSMTSNLSFQTELSSTTTGIFDNTAFPTSLNPSLTWKDNPTVTYEELTGEQYVTQMLSPIPADTIVLLLQSWPADMVLSIALNEINNVNNNWNPVNPNQSEMAKKEHVKFRSITKMIQLLNSQRTLEWRVTRANDTRKKTIDSAILLNRPKDEKTIKIVQTLLQKLGLSQDKTGTTTFKVEYGLEAKDDSTIIFGTRSMQDILSFASMSVAIPNHLQDAVKQIDANWTPSHAEELLTIKTSSSKPVGAAISIPYKNQWFYVEENDLQSKATILLIHILMSMQSGDSSSGAPVLTIPISS